MYCRGPLISLSLVLFLTGCATFTARRDDYVYEEVFYLTTRKETGIMEPLEDRYGEERGPISFGMAMIAIDPRETLSRFASPQPNYILEQHSLLRTREIQQLQSVDAAEFVDGIGKYPVGENEPLEVLVFIHGYKRSFEHVLHNAAHLRHELAFPGPVIAFCWPSIDSVSGYLTDLENLDWSQPELQNLISLVARSFPGARIHLMAHSLGNRALIRSLTRIATGRLDMQDCSLGEIIFMAPDFDRAVFMTDVADFLDLIPARKTLYVSAEDIPLMTSTRLFQYPRLGDSSEGIPVVKGVETIDVSDAITIMNGHGYYEANPATIEDLYHLVREGRGAAERPRLEKVETDDGPYWRLEAEPVTDVSAESASRPRKK